MKQLLGVGSAAFLLIGTCASHVGAQSRQESAATGSREQTSSEELHGTVHTGLNALSPPACAAPKAVPLQEPECREERGTTAAVRNEAGAMNAHEAPRLTIVSPREGEHFKNLPIVVEVAVENFELAPPIPYFGPPDPKPIGHIHYFFDDYPEIATSSTQIMLGKKEGAKYLRVGQHVLYAELVHNNHENLEPRVWRRVAFMVSH